MSFSFRTATPGSSRSRSSRAHAFSGSALSGSGHCAFAAASASAAASPFSTLPPPAALNFSPANGGVSPSSAASGGDASLPPKIPFRCSTVNLRGGPLLQGVEVECQRVYLDLHRATLNLQLKWNAAPHTTPRLGSTATSPITLPPPSFSLSSTSAAVSAAVSPASSPPVLHRPPLSGKKKRVRTEDDDDEADEPVDRSRLGLPPNALQPFTPEPTASSTVFSFLAPLPEQLPSIKRSRTGERSQFPMQLHSSSHFTTPSTPMWPAERQLGLQPSQKSVLSIPLSHCVGVDFSISLDNPATCTLALKPHSVYTTEPLHPGMEAPQQSLGSAVAELPIYSPARILMSTYRAAAAVNPKRFNSYARFVQRYMPPLLYWIWVHSSYSACVALSIGLLALQFSFWITGSIALLTYVVMLIREFRRAQEEFKQRLQENRSPMDECLYVHLVFSHDAYVSFLSFRRLFSKSHASKD